MTATGKDSSKTVLISKTLQGAMSDSTSQSCFWAVQSGQSGQSGFVDVKNDNQSDTHFQLNQNLPLEYLSLRIGIFQTLLVFSIKFTRIQSWNIHTVLALATSFNLTFHNANFDRFMWLLDARFDWLLVINKQNLPSSVMLSERYAYNIYGTFFPVFKHSGDWEISRKLCKPSTACRLYITFSNSITLRLLVLRSEYVKRFVWKPITERSSHRHALKIVVYGHFSEILHWGCMTISAILTPINK